MDVYPIEFDDLRGKAEAGMVMGAGFPDKYAPTHRAQNAGFPKKRKSMDLVSLRNTPALPVASSQMSRLFRPRGTRRGVMCLSAVDRDAVSEGEDREAWAALRKAE